MFTCNLRSILVRTTRYPNHPATCTRPWRASLRIAWVLYQLGLLHNAKKSTSAMSSPTMKSTLLPIQSQQLQFLATLSRNSLAIINKSNQNQYQWVLFLLSILLLLLLLRLLTIESHFSIFMIAVITLASLVRSSDTLL